MKPNNSICSKCNHYAYSLPNIVPLEVEKLNSVRILCTKGAFSFTLGHYSLSYVPVRAMTFKDIRAGGIWEPQDDIEVPAYCDYLLEHVVA